MQNTLTELEIIMKHNIVLIALGFTLAHAIPVSRAVITGFKQGVKQAEAEFAREEEIKKLNHDLMTSK